MIDFDPKKDEANRAKHGISLSRSKDLVAKAIWPDPHPSEPRRRAFGTIEGRFFCLVFTERAGRTRAISLRRVHAKEYFRYVQRTTET
jgi:uncharacterized protein